MDSEYFVKVDKLVWNIFSPTLNLMYFSNLETVFIFSLAYFHREKNIILRKKEFI